MTLRAESSRRLAPPDRAPRLRRAAELIERGALRSLAPDRARRLARDMRIRAAEVELGRKIADDTDEFLDAFAELSRPGPRTAL